MGLIGVGFHDLRRVYILDHGSLATNSQADNRLSQNHGDLFLVPFHVNWGWVREGEREKRKERERKN